jgi:CheY-like chemotaxis protein
MATVGSVLIVDDDADIRESLSLALELEGYAVEVARNGAEAWDRLCGGAAPALVLLDLAMPVLDGPGLLARLRADDRFRALPVVLVSAFGSLAAAEVRAAADGFLHKPVDLAVLLREVARRCRFAALEGSP